MRATPIRFCACRPGRQHRLRGRIGRPICNLRPSSRPALIDHFFETPAEHENDEDENNADYYDLPLRDRASGTDARGHPNAGRGREPLHVMTFLASDNDTRAQKTDANDSLSGPCASAVQVLQTVSVHYPRHEGRTDGDIGRANEWERRGLRRFTA
jgi:hypothetical protein